MVELTLDRRKIVEDIGMIELEIVQHGRSRSVVDKLGAFVEEGGVVFVGFDHEQRRLGMARRHGEIHGHPADEKARLASSPLEHPCKHGGNGGLAVRTRDSEHMLSSQN